MLSIPIVLEELKYLIFLFLFWLIIAIVFDKLKLESVLLMILMTPLSSHQNFYTISPFNFSELIVISFYIANTIKHLLKRKKITVKKINLLDKSILIFAVYLILNAMTSKNLNGTIEVIRDLKIFYIIIFTYFMIRDYIKSISDISELLNLIFISITKSSIIIFIIYIVKDVRALELLDWEGRYGNAFQTLYVLTIPYCIYLLSGSKTNLKEKNVIIISMLIQILLMSINGNRNLTIGLVITGIIALLKILINGLKSKKATKYLKSIIIFFSIIFITTSGVIYLYNTNSLLITRMMDMINERGTITNYTGRKLTNKYNFDLMKGNHIKGYGLGKKMYMVGPYGNIYSERQFIDNAYISFYYRFGLIVSFLLCSILIYYLIKGFVLNKDIFIICNLIILLISGGYFTAQIISNLPVNITFVALFLYSNRKKVKLGNI